VEPSRTTSAIERARCGFQRACASRDRGRRRAYSRPDWQGVDASKRPRAVRDAETPCAPSLLALGRCSMTPRARRGRRRPSRCRSAPPAGSARDCAARAGRRAGLVATVRVHERCPAAPVDRSRGARRRVLVGTRVKAYSSRRRPARPPCTASTRTGGLPARPRSRTRWPAGLALLR